MYIPIYINAYLYIFTYIYIHTYIHIYAVTLPNLLLPLASGEV